MKRFNLFDKVRRNKMEKLQFSKIHEKIPWLRVIQRNSFGIETGGGDVQS